jgi:hypothetical protein
MLLPKMVRIVCAHLKRRQTTLENLEIGFEFVCWEIACAF